MRFSDNRWTKAVSDWIPRNDKRTQKNHQFDGQSSSRKPYKKDTMLNRSLKWAELSYARERSGFIDTGSSCSIINKTTCNIDDVTSSLLMRTFHQPRRNTRCEVTPEVERIYIVPYYHSSIFSSWWEMIGLSSFVSTINSLPLNNLRLWVKLLRLVLVFLTECMQKLHNTQNSPRKTRVRTAILKGMNKHG